MNARLVVVLCAGFLAATISVPAARRTDPVAHFTGQSVVMTSPARLSMGAVDITVGRWSTALDQRELERAFLMKGYVAFMNLLCGFARAGSLTIEDKEIPLRYAWNTRDRDGGTRVYLATDEPIRLDFSDIRFFVDPTPLTFVELRLNRLGEGEGKLAPVDWLSVDESRNVIEISRYDHRPVDLIMVHDESQK